mmetsp:Transcript_59831/g.125032  ORF Transcript_59831/g.125032 Transcript_59831/m.125032 type:complete len:114 (+) Transcript_59831:1979-2320(+)
MTRRGGRSSKCTGSTWRGWSPSSPPASRRSASASRRRSPTRPLPSEPLRRRRRAASWHRRAAGLLRTALFSSLLTTLSLSLLFSCASGAGFGCPALSARRGRDPASRKPAAWR